MSRPVVFRKGVIYNVESILEKHPELVPADKEMAEIWDKVFATSQAVIRNHKFDTETDAKFLEISNDSERDPKVIQGALEEGFKFQLARIIASEHVAPELYSTEERLVIQKKYQELQKRFPKILESAYIVHWKTRFAESRLHKSRGQSREEIGGKLSTLFATLLGTAVFIARGY
jgi:hypothetical protein